MDIKYIKLLNTEDLQLLVSNVEKKSDITYQKKLSAGDNITITDDNVISAATSKPIVLDTLVTSTSTNGVESSGIYAAVSAKMDNMEAGQNVVFTNDKKISSLTNINNHDGSGDDINNESSYTITLVGASNNNGEIFNDYLFNMSIGDYSHAEGRNTKSSGFSSHAEGQGAQALGFVSHAEGQGTIASGSVSHTEGTSTEVYGEAAHAEGISSIANGNFSHVEGMGSVTSGIASHAEGNGSKSIGDYSHAEGRITMASGIGAHSEGIGAKAIQDGSHAEGSSFSMGYVSHAEGNLTQAIGGAAHSEGVSTFASQPGAHAEGLQSSASSQGSHSEGSCTTASNTAAHAEGNSCLAGGEYSHAEGNLNIVSGQSSHAEGSSNSVSGSCSHAEGFNNVIASTFKYSHVEGSYNIVSGDNQHIMGTYNKPMTNNCAFIIGNGSSDTSRNNCLTVDNYGNMVLEGELTDTKTYATYSPTEASLVLTGRSQCIYIGSTPVDITEINANTFYKVGDTLTIFGNGTFLIGSKTFTIKETESSVLKLFYNGNKFCYYV